MNTIPNNDSMYNYRLFAANSSFYWENTELCEINTIPEIQEPFCGVNEHLDPDIVKAFGTPRPSSRYYLQALFYWHVLVYQLTQERTGLTLISNLLYFQK